MDKVYGLSRLTGSVRIIQYFCTNFQCKDQADISDEDLFLFFSYGILHEINGN